MAEQVKEPKASRFRPVVLCILDGWGWREESEGNAIALAATPQYDALLRKFPSCRLEASGRAVGLPEGQMGNSEVGHMNIGAGRIVLQDLPRIGEEIESGSLAHRKALKDFIDSLRKSGGRAHLLGLVSPGGVHSHQDHIAAIAELLSGAGIEVLVHAFLDGRDTPPKSAREYISVFEKSLGRIRKARIATVTGRYYAMDRDRRWRRTERAYKAIVDANGDSVPSADAAIVAGYEAGTSDEFLNPTVVGEYDGMFDGDGLIVANFRADRVRQILSSILLGDFEEFDRSKNPRLAAALGMVSYSTELDNYLAMIMDSIIVEDSLGELVARNGLRQLRIAETEKYAHVTFFFNGGEERKFAGEDRILVPSPKVATYDLKPEMSAFEVTDKLVGAIESDKYDLIVVNYANPDMVGHTGKLDAAIKAVETIDVCLGRLVESISSAGGALVLTSDHGNVEYMIDAKDKGIHTAHTTSRVPLVLVSHDDVSLNDGKLADVAPTILSLMGLERPKSMTGAVLIDKEGCASSRNASEGSHARI